MASDIPFSPAGLYEMQKLQCSGKKNIIEVVKSDNLPSERVSIHPEGVVLLQYYEIQKLAGGGI
jgi:hypothetical protein